MQMLLYAPYGYAILLIVGGFVVARRKDHNGYFWMALILAELSRLGQMLFLVQNFGHPIYVFQFRGQSMTLVYTGLYLAGAASLAGLLLGMILYGRQKKAFPGLWLVAISLLETMVVAALRLFL
ncbi:MAG: hypothetical protein N3E49_05620 [Bacteroidia bacterium]|nr:hypothetical protein [Bacteroidia bacterium]